MTGAAGPGDPAAELEAIRARVAALSAPRHRAERMRLGARALGLAAAAGQPLAAVLAHAWRIDAAYQLLDLDAVDAGIAHLAQLAESTRLPLARWYLLRQQASRAALAGQLHVARDRSWQALRLAIRRQDPSGQAASCAFAIWLAVIRGDAAEIPADFCDRVPAASPRPAIRAVHAMALSAAGRTDQARAVYHTLRPPPAAGDTDARTLGVLLPMVVLSTAFGDREMAQALYGLLRPQAADAGAAGAGLGFVTGSLHWQLGQLAALAGQADQALGHFAEAVTVNTRIGARPFAALARLDWAGTLRGRAARGDLEQARILARRAAAEARRLGMPGPAARAERLARDLGQAIPAAGPLTRREREVAGLVSAGLSNRAIAGQLALSEQTIQAHIRNTLAKLQLASRAEQAVERFLRQFRTAGGWNRQARARPQLTAPAAPPPPKPRRVTRWIMTHPDHLASDDAANLARLLDASPALAAAAGHVRSFAGMMTRRQGLLALEDWLTRVEADNQPGLHSFARGIRRGQQAVTAGLALPCSSGALKGKNCKIKYLKRLMYGRANFLKFPSLALMA